MEVSTATECQPNSPNDFSILDYDCTLTPGTYKFFYIIITPILLKDIIVVRNNEPVFSESHQNCLNTNLRSSFTLDVASNHNINFNFMEVYATQGDTKIYFEDKNENQKYTATSNLTAGTYKIHQRKELS